MMEPDTPDLISAQQLQRIMGCSNNLALRFHGPLNVAMHRYGIDTAARIAAFMAQIGHESGRLLYSRELWGPTPAQQRYEGRVDLGNTQPGDGFRYRGRGLIQITGRANYARAGAALGLDLIAAPEALESPLYASLSAGWYWHEHRLNELADLGDFRRITRRINGGYNGMDDRIALLTAARKELMT